MGGSFPNPLCNRAVICTSFSFHLVSIVASFSVALLHPQMTHMAGHQTAK